ncbi:HdeD family acid-resistance protein [Nocardia sp. CDC153]|uniref:HdeD family acid-resistance protein n=1 Tax=Nocardia sp. CDC153 TaxID=3112167 RepID=UPI002DC055EE|nr:HdeD family acid-resistance protein [Nocardia sp. CDC153]MEC3956894.1 HdeD family acid-resistance protein [Nocardia sp. CDC153]
MSTVETSDLMRHFWKVKLGAGIAALVLGVLVLVWPGISILAAAVLFGIYLVASGLVEITFAFGLYASAPYRVLLFLTGALSIALGVLAFRHFGEGYAVLLLAIWIAVGFLFRGVAETATALSFSELPGQGWHVFFGVMSMIAGVVVLAWPFDSIVVLTVVTGIWLVALGAFEIASAFMSRAAVSSGERAASRIFGDGAIPSHG